MLQALFPPLDFFAPIPTLELEKMDVPALPVGERNILLLVCCKLLCAAAELVRKYSHISEDGQKLFQPEKETVGLCPRCGKPVYEGKKNFACSDRACQFVLWKNDRFFEQRGKVFTSKIAAALLKDGKAKVKGLRSLRTGKTYDGTIVLADTGGKYVNYRIEK